VSPLLQQQRYQQEAAFISAASTCVDVKCLLFVFKPFEQHRMSTHEVFTARWQATTCSTLECSTPPQLLAASYQQLHIEPDPYLIAFFP
jgi:hypothetical protein